MSSKPGPSLEADFLGTLAQILGDLRGYSTLAYELIQNADDAKGDAEKGIAPASKISFSVTDKEIVVRNDGTFSSCRAPELPECPLATRCDLHSFLRVAGETKRSLDDTTGAFGVGFTAVYQITDRPKLIAGGVHWELRPELPTGPERVWVCDGCAKCRNATGTTVILPWAKKTSELRRRLGVEPVFDPDGFVKELADSLGDALPFLRRVRRIELSRSGKKVASYSCEPDEDTVRLHTPDGTIEFVRLAGTFEDTAAELRKLPGDTIEDKRRSEVEVLVGPTTGRVIYAVLPTQEHLPAKLRASADFYPHSSRKHIRLDQDVRSNWNRAALRAIAETVADGVTELVERIGPAATWELIASIHETSDQRGDDEEAYADWWPTVAAAARYAETLPTATGELVAPDDAIFLPAADDDQALDLLAELGLNVADPRLRQLLASLPRSNDLGMSDLSPALLAEQLRTIEPSVIEAGDTRRTLWQLMERMLLRSKAARGHESARAEFASTRTAPGVNGELAAWSDVRRADDETVALFRDTSSLLDAVALKDLDELATLAQPFKVPDAIEAMEDAEHLDQELALLQWLADRREEIKAHGHKDRLRHIAIYPTRQPDHTQAFVALEQLSLLDGRHGAFEDVPGIATVLDTSIGEELVAFVRELGIESLDLATYITKHLTAALDEYEVDESPEWLVALLELLDEHVDEIRDDADLLDTLRDLALVPCRDGRRRPAGRAYLPTTAVIEVLGESAAIASVNLEVLRALDVGTEPRPQDVVERVQEITSEPPTEERIAIVHRIIEHLGHVAPRSDNEADRAIAAERISQEYSDLESEDWLPVSGDTELWHPPYKVYRVNRRHLFASQALFLDAPIQLADKAAVALEALDVDVDPPLTLVVAHLLHCAKHKERVSLDVYERLNRSVDDPQIERLRETESLYVGDERWIRPDEAFWEPHHLGHYGTRLDAESWEKWHPLLTKIEVRQAPDHDDALRILRRVADDHPGGQADDDQSVRALMERCWQLIDEALDAGKVQPAQVRGPLGDARCVLDGHGGFARPPQVFVEDRHELSKRFGDQLDGAVIPRPRAAWDAYQAAGVQGLRQACNPQVRHHGDEVRFATLKRHFASLEEQIARVIDDGVGSAALAPALRRLRALSVSRVENLEVQWVLRHLPSIKTNWAPAAVQYVPGREKLLVSAELEGETWIDVGRELAAAIAPEVGASALGLLKDVLAAEDPETADRVLDRCDVPRLSAELAHVVSDESAVRTPEDHDEDGWDPADTEDGSVTGQPGSEDTDDADDTDEPTGSTDESGDAGDSTDTEGTGTGQRGSAGTAAPGQTDGTGGTGTNGRGGGSDGTSGGPERTKSPRRRKPKPSEWWQVIVSGMSDPDDQDDGLDGSASERAKRRAQIDAAGVAEVLRHERAAGRAPKEMRHDNPGYDIESRDSDGNVVRNIEVKSLAGQWGPDGFPKLTPEQFRYAADHTDTSWLYVVEHAESPAPRITRIQNPARRATRFVFDPGWEALGEQLDEREGVCDELIEIADAVEASGLPAGEFGYQPDDGDVIFDLAWPDLRYALIEPDREIPAMAEWTVVLVTEVSVEDVVEALMG